MRGYTYIIYVGFKIFKDWGVLFVGINCGILGC